MSEPETPWAFVVRRRAEGTTQERIATALREQGLDADDVALLLRRQSTEAARGDSGPATASRESAWSVLQRMRAEGFPREAIEAELRDQGHPSGDVTALFADEPMQVAPGRTPVAGASTGGPDAVNIIFGAALVVLGGAILLAGVIGLLPIGLILSGFSRVAVGLQAQRSQAAADAIASDGLRALKTDDPRARCSLHAQYAAIGTCARCGAFCCAGCVTSAGFSTAIPCLSCHRRPEYLAERLLVVKQRSAWRLLLGPALLVLIFAIEVAGSDDSRVDLGIAFLTGALSTPWLVLVAIQFVSRRLWPTFLSAFVWLATTAFFALLVAHSEGAPLHLGAWLFAAWPATSAWVSKRTLEAPVSALIPEVSATATPAR